jgi:hypothetical protein
MQRAATDVSPPPMPLLLPAPPPVPAAPMVTAFDAPTVAAVTMDLE